MEAWLLILAGATAALALLWRREAGARQRAAREARHLMQATEEARKRSEARGALAESACQASGDPLLVVGPDLRLRYANGAARARFGETSDGLALIAYSGSLPLEDLARRALNLREGESLTEVVQLADRPYRARAVMTAEGLGLSLTDVAELLRLARARQDLVANLAHELRTPLTSLQLLADTLRSRSGHDAQVVQDLAAKVVAEVDLLTQMTQEMLDLAAIESGQQAVRLTPVAAAELIRRAVERVEDEARRGGVTLVVEAGTAVFLLADEEQAERALRNVLHNAVKFSPPGGEVRLAVRVDEAEARAVISVEDSGPGIHPAELERIFERFYRSDRARGTPGTGLGLAIASHILRAHRGAIWAENRAPPASGAVFHLAFPLA